MSVVHMFVDVVLEQWQTDEDSIIDRARATTMIDTKRALKPLQIGFMREYCSFAEIMTQRLLFSPHFGHFFSKVAGF